MISFLTVANPRMQNMELNTTQAIRITLESEQLGRTCTHKTACIVIWNLKIAVAVHQPCVAVGVKIRKTKDDFFKIIIKRMIVYKPSRGSIWIRSVWMPYSCCRMQEYVPVFLSVQDSIPLKHHRFLNAGIDSCISCQWFCIGLARSITRKKQRQ
jgi:hypothetical protein